MAQVLRHIEIPSSQPSLLVGLDAPDDAAVYRIDDDVAIVQTVDFLTSVVDDPFSWGRIAAANALSDIYAMGGRPITALGLVGWPRGFDLAILGRVLDGVSATCSEADVPIVGGHSLDDPVPKVGLAVTGTVAPDAFVRKTGAGSGCELVLTKPLGAGIISAAALGGKAPPQAAARAVKTMCALNRAASDAMLEAGAVAATDVTGFGLIGHVLEMLDAETAAEIYFDEIAVLDDALDLASRGVTSSATLRNRRWAGERADVSRLTDGETTVVFDAQTSGGLLVAVPDGGAAFLLASLAGRGVADATLIGRVVAGRGGVTVFRA